MYCCSMCDHDALMSVLCFIDTFIPKHVDMFMDLGFHLRTSEVYAWGSCYVHLSLLGMLFHFMVQYLCLFSLILQGLLEEGEYQQLEF